MDIYIYTNKIPGVLWETGQFKQSKSFYTQRETEGSTQYWNFNLDVDAVVSSVSISSSGSRYTLQARATTNDSWTQLAYWKANSGGSKEINNKNKFKYFRLVAEGASEVNWISPAGNYYWSYANNLTINYKYKK